MKNEKVRELGAPVKQILKMLRFYSLLNFSIVVKEAQQSLEGSL